MKSTNIALLAKSILAVFFLLSGFSKLISPSEATTFFVETMGSGFAVARVTVILLSVVECLLAVGLFIPKLSLGSTFIIVLLLSVFTVFGASSGNSNVSCGCFGSVYETEIDSMFFARNSSLILIALLNLRTSDGEWRFS